MLPFEVGLASAPKESRAEAHGRGHRRFRRLRQVRGNCSITTSGDTTKCRLYRASAPGIFDDVSIPFRHGAISKYTGGSASAACFWIVNLDGALELASPPMVTFEKPSSNIRGNVGYARPPPALSDLGGGKFRDVLCQGRRFRISKGRPRPRLWRLRPDGDLDMLLTTKPRGGIFSTGTINRKFLIAFVFNLRGTKSNRDATAASVRIFLGRPITVAGSSAVAPVIFRNRIAITFGLGLRR